MNHSENANRFLIEESLGTLMRKYSIPCIISLLVAALYNIVDQIFIANASYLGSYGNAANTVVFPLTVVALAIAVMIGDGCCAFVSICLGKGEQDAAKRSIGNTIVLTVGVSILLMAFYLIFADGIITAFGGSVNPETFRNAQEYFFWITLGIPFYMFGQAMNPVIRSDGSPRFAMASTLAGAVFNIIFDPILIYGAKWGMMGAAVATIAGQILTAVMALWYLPRMKSVKLDRSSFSLDAGLIAKFVPLGITSLLSQISVVASMAAVNNMVRKYGALDPVFGQEQYAQIPMAVVGIVMKFFQIVISVAVGLAAGCIPVVGYNIGAGRQDRAKGLFILLLKCEAVTGLIALLLVELLPRQLIGLFGAGNESVYYTEFGIRCFRIYLCMIVLALINKGSFIFLQSLGKAKESSVLSLIREILFGVGLTLLLPAVFALNGVLYSMPVSDALTFLLSAFVIRRTCQELSTDAQ